MTPFDERDRAELLAVGPESARIDPWGPSFELECDDIYLRFLKYTQRLPPPLATRALALRSYLGDNQRSSRLERIPDIIRVITILPFLFQDVFPVERSKATTFAYALTIGGLFAMAEDKLIDSQAEPARSQALLVPSLYGEFVRALSGIFPPDSDFWSHYDTFFRQYQLAELKDGDVTGRAATRAAARYGIAKAKSAPMKLAPCGMAILSGRSDHIDRFLRSFDYWITGYQLYDDIVDWREDYLARRRSLAMGRIERLVGAAAAGEKRVRLAQIERTIHASDIFESMIEESGRWFDKAVRAVNGITCRDWVTFLENFKRITNETVRGLVTFKTKILLG